MPQDVTPAQARRGLAWLSSPTGTAVVALGITQITAWGTTLYVLGVLGAPIMAELGWSRSLVFGGLTAGLLVSALVSTWTGRMIDRRGARLVMSIGSVLSAIGLAALSQVRDPFTYLAVWAFLGVAMRFTLYDAAFAALVQVTPAHGRRAISYLTLFGGFASTIFWPIGHWLDLAIGWRATLLVFAGLGLLVCLPLHWWGLARREPDAPASAAASGAAVDAATPRASPLHGRERIIAMVLFSCIMSANAFVFGAVAVHLVGIIEHAGVTLAVAVWLASLKGVAQVIGRTWEILFARTMAPVNLARVAVHLLPVAFVTLLAAAVAGPAETVWVALAFTLLLGASNGLVTIVRGAFPLALFGPKGYGEVLGILATPYLILNALAPVLFAVVVEWGGYGLSTWLLIAFALIATSAMEVLAWWYGRRQRGQTAPEPKE
ncbi:MAG: MFS transporter [Hyphomicrobiaceae bacterium]